MGMFTLNKRRRCVPHATDLARMHLYNHAKSLGHHEDVRENDGRVKIEALDGLQRDLPPAIASVSTDSTP
jgi:hypothetical protein